MEDTDRLRPPRPWGFTLPALLFQAFGILLLPFVVGMAAAMVFQASEVADTAAGMTIFTLLFLFPVTLAQIVGLVLKSRRELRFWAQRGALSWSRALDVMHEHTRVVTVRGWTMLLSGLLLVVLSLALRWASFGTLAVMGLFLFYLVTGWTVFLSTFLVGSFEAGLAHAERGVRRKFIPAVTVTGDSVEEVLSFRHIRVPWGYYLLVEDFLPVRLGTDSRYAVGATARGSEVEVRGRLRRTARGHYFVGPARLWYQDLLGITRVSLASVATAELKVLPRFRPVEVLAAPRTPMDAPDVLTRPHRFPTEDHFRFREYAPGDDTRRIHWRLSMKTGHLQVRQPENREMDTRDVVLVLDTYLPRGRILDAAHGAEEILDALVEAWLGIARELSSRGDRVTLLAACSGASPSDVQLCRLACRPGTGMRWQDLGARARWQADYDLGDMLSEIGPDVHGVVVTARFTAPPPALAPGQTLSWLFMDPAEALGPPDPHWLREVIGGEGLFAGARWALTLPHAAGSEENALHRRIARTFQLRHTWHARRALRQAAVARAGRIRRELEARGDAVYRIERSPTHVRLVGLQAREAKRKAS